MEEKEKSLVTSNFSFSHNVFNSYISSVRQNVALCGFCFKSTSNLDTFQSQLFTKDNILDWFKLKAFADDKLHMNQILHFVFVRVENIAGKRRKCWLPAFSPFPTMFSKGFCSIIVKSQDCMVKG